MKAFTLATIAGFVLLGAIGSTAAQPYDGYGPRDRDYDRDYRGDDRGEDRRHRGDARDRQYDRRGGRAFNESEYLRCNGDVRRAVRNGQMESGRQHYEMYGRREGRKLSC